MRVGNGIELRQGHVLGLLASFAHTGRKHTRSAHLPEPLHSLASNQIKIKGLLVITFFTPSPPPPLLMKMQNAYKLRKNLFGKSIVAIILNS